MLVFRRSFSAYIISFLVFLRILPRGRSKVLDVIGFIFWMGFTIGLTAAHASFRVHIYVSLLSKSISGVFSFLSILTPMVQPVLALPALSYLFHKNPCLVTNKQLPSPRYPTMFVFNVVLNLGFLKILVETFITSSNQGTFFQVFHVSYYCLWTLTMILISFVIGTSLEEFCKKLSQTTHPTIMRIDELSQDLKQLKTGLSPILLMLFSTKCILLINNSLNLFVDNQKGMSYWGVSALATILWDLTYVVVVLDTTISKYKDLTLQLR